MKQILRGLFTACLLGSMASLYAITGDQVLVRVYDTAGNALTVTGSIGISPSNVWVTSGTITVDNLNALLKEGGFVRIINSTTSVVNFPADYPNAALAGKIVVCNTKAVAITSGTISVDNLPADYFKAGGSIGNTSFLAVQSGEWVIKKATVVVENQILQPIQDGGNVNIGNYPAVQSVSEEKAALGDESNVSVSSTSVITINARAARKSITVQTRGANTGSIYLRLGGVTTIRAKGIELVAGQSWGSSLYTGAVYIQTEAGKSAQEVIYQEEY